LIWYHLVAFSIGIILDLIIGDPQNMPHPVRLIGRLISKLDKAFMDKEMFPNTDESDNRKGSRNPNREAGKGLICVLIVLLATLISTSLLILLSYSVNSLLGIIVEAVLTSYCLAAKSLKTESLKVYNEIKRAELEKARYYLSMIVGRDTINLDEEGIIKAAVETVAENTSDGVIAPMIYLLIGGPVLGMTYKAVNTMDSMIAYHNDRYENFGKSAAKLDDLVNFIPSRISAVLMIFAAYLGRDFSGEDALRIFKRDRFNHKSPNSAQTESACAGALKIQLAGDAYYFGKLVKKPYIGDPTRKIENEDIKRVNNLMYLTTDILIIVGEAVMILLYFIWG